MSKTLKIFFATLLLVIIAFALYMFVIYPLAWKAHAKKESVRVLLAANTTNELDKAVGSLGLFLAFPDNAWIAIRYRDSHSGGVFSSAVARDSGGNWYESCRHYCGQFMHYADESRRYVELNAELKALGSNDKYDMNPYCSEVHTLAQSSDLANARKNLVAMGFSRIETPPNKPSLSTAMR